MYKCENPQQNQQNNKQINTQQQNQQKQQQISLIAQHSATKTIKTQILPPFSLLIASEGGGKKENNNNLLHSSSNNFDEKLKIKPFGNNRTLQGICEDRITVCWWTQERCFAPSIFQIMRTLCPKTCHFC